MRKTLIAAAALGIAPFLASGCVTKGEYMKQVQAADQMDRELAGLKARYNALVEENNGLKSDLASVSKERAELDQVLRARSDELSRTIADLRQRIAALGAENTRLMRDLADERKAKDEAQRAREDAERARQDAEKIRDDAEKGRDEAQRARDAAQRAKEDKLREVSSTYEQLLDKMKNEIAQGQVTISELKGKLTVNLVEAILFDSGRAEVKPGGLVVLGKVIEILRTVKDKAVRIEGHTDNVAITPSLAQRYPTNWELSAARAINVARYLQKQSIDPTNLSAAGFGEYKPVADNSTPEGRAKNRRIEIVLVPRD
jgi:chemotaxis protein MotB